MAGAGERLKKDVWNKPAYYHLAQKGSLDVYHPGMRALKKLAPKAEKILDLGCGEGTRLSWLAEKGRRGVGVDISPTAIKMAQKSYPQLEFIQADLEKIPLESESFDLVYSAYVLEHLEKPEKVLQEAIRLTKKDGSLVLIAPNFGAPNRASPPFAGSRLIKLIRGFLDDSLRIFKKAPVLAWHRVKPLANSEKYQIDWDTTVEPYLGTLISFLKVNGMEIEEATSCWEYELAGAKPHQRIFKALGQFGIYPFTIWGPHLVVVAKK